MNAQERKAEAARIAEANSAAIEAARLAEEARLAALDNADVDDDDADDDDAALDNAANTSLAVDLSVPIDMTAHVKRAIIDDKITTYTFFDTVTITVTELAENVYSASYPAMSVVNRDNTTKKLDAYVAERSAKARDHAMIAFGRALRSLADKKDSHDTQRASVAALTSDLNAASARIAALEYVVALQSNAESATLDDAVYAALDDTLKALIDTTRASVAERAA